MISLFYQTWCPHLGGKGWGVQSEQERWKREHPILCWVRKSTFHDKVHDGDDAGDGKENGEDMKVDQKKQQMDWSKKMDWLENFDS